MITHTIDSAAEFLNISVDAMKDLAGKGVVPGAKIGKSWVFSEDLLTEYLHSEIKRQTAERRGGSEQVQTAYAKTVRRKAMTPPALKKGSSHACS